MKRLLPVCCALGIVVVGCGANPPASLEFQEVTPAQPRIGEIATIRFLAIDSRGVPMSGAQVSFRLQNEAPGVTLSPQVATATKGTGIAEVQVVASSRVSSIVVIAESDGVTAFSPPITFAGALPSARQFTFQCGEIAGNATGGIHGLIAYDDSRNLVAGVAMNCIAHVGDRNGDGVVGAQVSFITEAGTIGPTQASQTDRIGDAKILYKTSLPLPKEVAPVTFTWTPANSATQTGDYVAPLWMHPYDWITNPILGVGTPGAEPRRNDPVYELLSGTTRVNNPRDNLVAMVAVTTGEEAFDDVNNNGRYDTGEPFTDLTEPFVDSNDNGTWDPDERYIDTNANGIWDGKNGVFDESTLIWAQEKLLWTGLPNLTHDTRPPAPVFRQITPAGPVQIPHLGCVSFQFIASDPWFNPVARPKGNDGCTMESSSEAVVALPKEISRGALTSYPAGIIYGGSVCDAHTPEVLPDGGTGELPAPGAAFTAIAECTHSWSTLSEGEVTILFNAASGTVR